MTTRNKLTNVQVPEAEKLKSQKPIVSTSNKFGVLEGQPSHSGKAASNGKDKGQEAATLTVSAKLVKYVLAELQKWRVYFEKLANDFPAWGKEVTAGLDLKQKDILTILRSSKVHTLDQTAIDALDWPARFVTKKIRSVAQEMNDLVNETEDAVRELHENGEFNNATGNSLVRRLGSDLERIVVLYDRNCDEVLEDLKQTLRPFLQDKTLSDELERYCKLLVEVRMTRQDMKPLNLPLPGLCDLSKVYGT